MARTEHRPPAPIGFAHRGARDRCADNTLPGFALALELGATGLESDVWLSAEGIAVLDHDGLVRSGLRRRPFAALARADLPAHVPDLAALYRHCGSAFELSLDVKDPRAAEVAVSEAAAAGAVDRLWLCGNGASLREWRVLSPEVRLVESTRMARVHEGLPRRVAILADAGIDAVNLRWSDWRPEMVEAVHDAGLAAFAWDLQRRNTLEAALAWGIDGLYSDHVELLTAVLHPEGPGLA